MSWRLEVTTKDGVLHTVDFDAKEEAQAALKEVQAQMGRAGKINVKDELVVIAANVTTVKVYESGPMIA